MLIGIMLFGAGILLLLGTIFPSWGIDWNIIWPICLILISLYEMFKNRIFDVVNTILFYIGVFFFLENVHVFRHSITHLFFPILLILIGGIIMIDRMVNKRKRVYKTTKKGLVEYNGIFGEINEKVENKKWKGAKITAIFGGVDLDLRDVESKEINLEIVTIFGNSNLVFPEEYDVEFHSFALFGGNENKYKNVGKKGKIVVTCTSIFGGVEVK